MTEKSELVSVVVLGRPIVFKTFNDVQLALIHRMQRILTAASEAIPDPDADDTAVPESAKQAVQTGLGAVEQFLTMVENLAVDPMDRLWLVEQMLAGNMDLTTVSEFVRDMVPTDKQAKKGPVRKATRAR